MRSASGSDRSVTSPSSKSRDMPGETCSADSPISARARAIAPDSPIAPTRAPGLLARSIS